MTASSVLITPKDIKARSLAGLDAWFIAAEKDGYDEDAIANTILERTKEFEEEVEFRLRQTQVVSAPDGAYDKTTEMPVVVERGYPFFSNGGALLACTLYKRPVQRVQRLRMMLNGTQLVFTPPVAWYQVDQNGRFSLLPLLTSGSYQSAVSGLAMLQIDFLRVSAIPNFLFFDYVAGLTPDEWASDEWAQARRLLRTYCAQGVLDEIAHSKSAGRNQLNISVDGGSQGINYTRFEDKKQELALYLQTAMPTFKAKHTPVLLDLI